MSASGDGVKIPLEVAMNKEKTKVLFAEVDRDFVDVLLSFLTLPLGGIVKLLQNYYGNDAPSIGSLDNLYDSLVVMNDVHFWTKEGKLMLLDPKNNFQLRTCREMKLNIDDSVTKYYACEDAHVCNRISTFGNVKCESCGKSMRRELPLRKSADTNPTITSRSFILSDDLQLAASDFFVQNVRQLCTSDIDGMTTRTVQFGLDDAMEMLKGLFVSQTPLTDFVCGIEQQASIMQDHPKHDIDDHNFAPSKSKKILIKALVQKSRNKLLFVQAKDDFVDFLFSLLIIPLVTLAHLFGGNTPVMSINNLYQSVHNLDKDDLLMSPKEKALILTLPQIFHSKSNILPLLTETLYLKFHGWEVLPLGEGPCGASGRVNFVDPKGCNGCYIRGRSMFLVNDDLTFIPSTILSDISRLKAMNVPMSDVDEVELHVGVKEALRILNASLTSTKVFTDVFSPVLKK